MKQAREKPKVLCLTGPTACGKTALALELAARYPLQIISVDSAQIYRGMDIGTGKPDAATLTQVPHKLIDIRDPAEIYSAAEFCTDAQTEIQAAWAAGKLPLLVGGTMLYFKALRDGLADMPQANEEVRQQIAQLAASSGWEAVHARLQEVDPKAAARIHPNDPQRLQRALEVYLLTGKPMSEQLSEQHAADVVNYEPPFSLEFYIIEPAERSVLHEQIARRFQAMLAQGLLEEVRALYARDDLNPLLPSMKSVGYRQIWQHLAGKLSYQEMVEKSIIATRQLAKRQLTWLRSWQGHRLTPASQAAQSAGHRPPPAPQAAQATSHRAPGPQATQATGHRPPGGLAEAIEHLLADADRSPEPTATICR